MMYNSKLVASVKANGRILREFKENVYIPFGSEYSILLKNLNTVRAIVNVFIDGENQVPGGLVLNAGQEIDLQRSIKNGNLTEGNRFKFIEFTPGIESHRGAKLEDGVLRIEYQFEKYVPPARDYWSNRWIADQRLGAHNLDEYSYTKGSIRDSGIGGSSLRSFGASSTLGASYDATKGVQSNVMLNSANASRPINDAGITVAGSKSDQRFVTVSDFAVEAEKHTIVLKLLGETQDNKPVAEAVTVRHNPECTTCGKKNKATAKFCTECGTALTIY